MEEQEAELLDRLKRTQERSQVAALSVSNLEAAAAHHYGLPGGMQKGAEKTALGPLFNTMDQHPK